MEQGASQLCEQLEEDVFDEEMDVNGHVDECDGAGDDEQDHGAEKAKRQPEHLEEEKEMVNNTSTLRARNLLSCAQRMDTRRSRTSRAARGGKGLRSSMTRCWPTDTRQPRVGDWLRGCTGRGLKI